METSKNIPETTQNFTFEDHNITFLTSNDNIMINATEMAKQFDVKPNFWLKTAQAQGLINAISKLKKINYSDLVEVRAGSPENGGGTWMHKDVALPFAQWLSPELYIWCNDRIFELFKYGLTALKEETRENLFKLSEAVSVLKKDSTTELGVYGIYKEMKNRGILNKYNRPYPEYIEKGYFKLVPYPKNKYVKSSFVTEDGLKWLLQILFPNINNNDDIKRLEYEINLALQGIETILENLLVSKSRTPLSEEQNRLNIERMKSICSEIKSISEKNNLKAVA